MANSRSVLTMQITCRWWLRHYLCAVLFGAWLTGRRPDPDKVDSWIRRGLVLRVVRSRGELVA